MYPKDCCKIQAPYVIDIPTHYIHIIQSCHHIMTPHSVRCHKFDNIAYKYHSIRFHVDYMAIVFLQLSPATSNFKILIYLYDLKNKAAQILN